MISEQGTDLLQLRLIAILVLDVPRTPLYITLLMCTPVSFITKIVYSSKFESRIYVRTYTHIFNVRYLLLACIAHAAIVLIDDYGILYVVEPNVFKRHVLNVSSSDLPCFDPSSVCGSVEVGSGYSNVLHLYIVSSFP